jgi:hypothetical protein
LARKNEVLIMTAKYAVITKPAHIHVEHAADIFGHLKAGGTSPLGIIWAGLKLLCGAGVVRPREGRSRRTDMPC